MSQVEHEAYEAAGSEEEEMDGTRKLEPGAEVPQPRVRRIETRKLEPEPEESGQATATLAPAPYLGLTRDEMTWAALAHASILLTFFLGLVSGGLAAILGPIIPGIIWYVHRDKSDYVVDQARQATIFQLAGMVALLALAVVGAVLVALGWAVSAVLVIVLIGLLLLLVMVVVTLLWIVGIIGLPIAMVVYGCFAALETYNGRPFRYWLIADLIDRYLAQT